MFDDVISAISTYFNEIMIFYPKKKTFSSCGLVFLQVLSWGSSALIAFASEAFPILLACVRLSNIGASIEVAKDAKLTIVPAVWLV